MKLPVSFKCLLTILASLPLSCPVSRAVDPVVSNVRGLQRTDGSELVDIYYIVTDPDSPTVTVRLEVSADEGDTWNVPVNSVSQDVGPGVVPRKDRYILWNAGADWNNQYSNKVRFRVTASDTPPVAADMVLIPAGSFEMGNALSVSGDGNGDELPVHSVFVSAFYLDKYEVTKGLWDEVGAWGVANGYSDLPTGGGKGINHPVHTINWYATVKWCNARSQREGLAPCYRVGGSVYKTGSSAPDCNWSANGYRLPTEAEWEKAARDGLSGKRFPWGDMISHSQANYRSSTSDSYDVSPTRGYHPAYYDGVTPYTSPVGSFTANGYGVFDMSGNMWEWCWDWYSSSFYASSPGTDPRGPVSGSARVPRGGNWYDTAGSCRAADRTYFSPEISVDGLGFRSARSAVP